MSVRRLANGDVELSGDCPSGEAETLRAMLAETPGAAVDWRGCQSAHTAVVQVLMAHGGPRIGPPGGTFLRRMVEPAINRG